MGESGIDGVLEAMDRHAANVCIICAGPLTGSGSDFLCSPACRQRWVALFRSALDEARPAARPEEA